YTSPQRDSTYFEIKPNIAISQQDPIPPTTGVAQVSVRMLTPGMYQPNQDNKVGKLKNKDITEQYFPPLSQYPKNKNTLFRTKKPLIIQSFATLLFIFGLYVALDGWMINRAAQTQVKVLAVQASNSNNTTEEAVIDEEPTSGPEGYHVAPELPRALFIPSINVSTRVLHLGVEKDNSLSAPSSISDAGWYNASAKPGDTHGAMLIDGHVSGPSKKGVFYNIKNLKAGDEIIVEKGDSSRFTFLVKDVNTVSANQVDMAKMLESFEPSRLGLNLITCGGQFNSTKNQYESRVLVFAVLK
ncbi:MAG: class F sortase, partial [Candidatus Saccharimonadales bacterium]